VDDLWATKSEDVGLIVRTISFQEFPPTSQTDGQTASDSKTALCTVVHRAVIKRVTTAHWTASVTAKSVESITVDTS